MKCVYSQALVRLQFLVAVLFAVLMFVVTVALAPVHAFYRRHLCLYEGPPTDIKTLHAEMQTAFEAMKKGVTEAREVAAKAIEEVKALGTIHGSTNEKLTKVGEELKPLSDALAEVKNRIQEVEQERKGRGGSGGADEKSVGEIFVESTEYKDMLEHGRFESKRVKVGSVRNRKVAIINATGQNQPLVPAMRFPGIVFNPEQRLTIRDLMPVVRTTSNSIEWVKELVFTNNAGPQYDTSSPTPGQEGAVKPESGITFQLNNTPVTTLAHWIPASRQVLSDAPMLQDYINMRLMYGLRLEEEDELLNGDGTNGTLTGLKAQATAFTGGNTNANLIDTLLRAFTQVRLAFYEPNGAILHPTDWVERVALLKDSEGRYLFSNPHSMERAVIWGKPVVETVSQTLGEFTVGAFDRAAQIVDREDANIRVSEHHADFFVRNMVAILCEERLALLVTRPAAIVDGSVSFAG